MFHGWDGFFGMAGTAAATLIGLLFVAITLGGGGLSTPRGRYGTSAFLTPTLVRFGGVLLQSLTVLVPWPSAWAAGIILSLSGLAGLLYQIHIIREQRKIDFAAPDWFDWMLFSAMPALCDASLVVGAVGLIAGRAFAPYAIAGATALLLFTGICGAWDLTLWMARNRIQS